MTRAVSALLLAVAFGCNALGCATSSDDAIGSDSNDLRARSIFTITNPTDGAAVSGTIQIQGSAGSRWLNVAAYDQSGAKITADVAPNGGTFSLSLDTRALPDGADTISVLAFSVAAGQTGGINASATVTLKVVNSSAAQPPPAPSTSSAPAPAPPSGSPSTGSNHGIMLGMNGHPYGGLSGGPYNDINQQMSQMASMGIMHYRVDFYGTDSEEFDLMNRLLAAAAPYGIVVTPVLIMSPDFFSGEQDAYDGGYSFGKAWASAFSGTVTFYEIGNEENEKVLPPFQDNSSPDVWESASAFPRERGILRGLLDGVHAGGGKGALGDAGGCNYGFEEALWQDGLRWDATVVHPYDFWGYPSDISKVWWNGAPQAGCSGGNDMLGKHAQFGQPLWLTEFTWTPGVTNNDKGEIGSGVVSMVETFESLAQQYDIEVADIYELYDEPGAAGAEAHFGIFTSDGLATAASVAIKNFTASNPSAVYPQ